MAGLPEGREFRRLGRTPVQLVTPLDPSDRLLLGAADSGVLKHPWAATGDDLARALDVLPEAGLSPADVRARLARFGANELLGEEPEGAWAIARRQFKNLVVWVLLGAAAASFAFGEPESGLAVLLVVVINSIIGFVVERHAIRSMDALRAMGGMRARVRRGGETLEVAAEGLVPGDVVLAEAGDVLAADVRLIQATSLLVDESALTGESVPVDKSAEPCPEGTTLSDRGCMLHRGTSIARGAGEGLVVATGMWTALGEISALVSAARGGSSPLQARLDVLGRRLIFLTLCVAVAVTLAMWGSGRSVLLAVEIGVALAVATIPEGLPVVATIALARGMVRMARRDALVESLGAVETLGSTSVLLTDKTGTLTENRMTVVEYALEGASVRVGGVGGEGTGTFEIEGQAARPEDVPALHEALRIGLLCNDAELTWAENGQMQGAGDPTEVALLVAGKKAGLERSALEESAPRVGERPFDSGVKLMATLHGSEEAWIAAVKGAPEAVIERCANLGETEQGQWLACAEAMGARGQRVLGLATRTGAGAFDYLELELVGLVGILDPPKASARDTIERLHRAGVRVAMVTGDHVATGVAIAREVGLIEGSESEGCASVDAREMPSAEDATDEDRSRLLRALVIGRATPRQKLDLIELHQGCGAVVAMVGDGVNDAPALRRADIGVAMGLRGTQVAREAADMILRDDDIESVYAAVEEGRAIFRNIRRFVVYLLSCNVSEIFVVGAGALQAGPLPLLPLHILFLNMVTDVFPALALGTCAAGKGIMHEAPRATGESILMPRHWRDIFAAGAVLACAVLASLAVAVHVLELGPTEATTTAFLTLAMAQLWHTLAMRNHDSPALRNEVTRNPWVWASIVGCMGLLVLAVHVVPLRQVLELADPGLAGWALALGFSAVPSLLVDAWRRTVGSRRGETPETAQPLAALGESRAS